MMCFNLQGMPGREATKDVSVAWTPSRPYKVAKIQHEVDVGSERRNAVCLWVMDIIYWINF